MPPPQQRDSFPGIIIANQLSQFIGGMVDAAWIVAEVLKERYKTKVVSGYGMPAVRVWAAGNRSFTIVLLDGSKVRCHYGNVAVELADPEGIWDLFNMVEHCRARMLRMGEMTTHHGSCICKMCGDCAGCSYYGGT